VNLLGLWINHGLSEVKIVQSGKIVAGTDGKEGLLNVRILSHKLGSDESVCKKKKKPCGEDRRK